MTNSWNPDMVQPTAGHYVGEVVQRLGGRSAGGLHILGNDNNTRMDTCVVRILKMGPLPAVETLTPHARGRSTRVAGVGSGWVKDASTPWPPAFFPAGPGDYLWTSRDFPKVWIHKDEHGEDRKYVLGRCIDALAMLEGWEGIANFEQVA